MTFAVGDVVDYQEYQWQVVACEMVPNQGGPPLPDDPLVTLERYEPVIKGRGRRHVLRVDARYCRLVGRQLSLMEVSVERDPRAYPG